MVKAIFFDIDGTLVSFKNHQIPKSTFDALYKLKEKGIKHEFRVRDGGHTWSYWRTALPSVLEFISKRFNRS